MAEDQQNIVHRVLDASLKVCTPMILLPEDSLKHLQYIGNAHVVQTALTPVPKDAADAA